MTEEFLEEHRLAANPFTPGNARPFVVSHSLDQLRGHLSGLINGDIEALSVTGPAVVGKTSAIRDWFNSLPEDVARSWIDPDLGTQEAFLQRLLVDLGLQPIQATPDELRRILEAFLGHQVASGRRSVVVADELENMPAQVLGELEWLKGLHHKSNPLVRSVVVTRNEALVRRPTTEREGSVVHRRRHYPLTGFTLEETLGYLIACLDNAGCAWTEQIISDEAAQELYRYTAGVVGDLDRLAEASLERLAAAEDRSTLTLAHVHEAAEVLSMRPVLVSEQIEGPLTADSVSQSHWGRASTLHARLLVASGGRIVAQLDLSRPRMVLGRDPDCDLSLDSRYVSRYQNLFMETQRGWVMLDLNSTNGSYVNGRRVKEHLLGDGDVIAVGRHQLRFLSPGSRADLVHSAQISAAQGATSAPTDAKPTDSVTVAVPRFERGAKQ